MRWNKLNKGQRKRLNKHMHTHTHTQTMWIRIHFLSFFIIRCFPQPVVILCSLSWDLIKFGCVCFFCVFVLACVCLCVLHWFVRLRNECLDVSFSFLYILWWCEYVIIVIPFCNFSKLVSKTHIEGFGSFNKPTVSSPAGTPSVCTSWTYVALTTCWCSTVCCLMLGQESYRAQITQRRWYAQ